MRTKVSGNSPMPLTAEDRAGLARQRQQSVFCSCMIGPNEPWPECPECGGSGLPRPLDRSPEVQDEFEADVRAIMAERDGGGSL